MWCKFQLIILAIQPGINPIAIFSFSAQKSIYFSPTVPLLVAISSIAISVARTAKPTRKLSQLVGSVSSCSNHSSLFKIRFGFALFLSSVAYKRSNGIYINKRWSNKLIHYVILTNISLFWNKNLPVFWVFLLPPNQLLPLLLCFFPPPNQLVPELPLFLLLPPLLRFGSGAASDWSTMVNAAMTTTIPIAMRK